MSELIETRKKIEDIKSKYDEKITVLQEQIVELENQRDNELGDLPAQYDALTSELVDDYTTGKVTNLDSGVSIRTLKTICVVNNEIVPVKYMMYIPNEKLIKEDIKKSGYTLSIPGVNVTNKYVVAVKLKN